MTTCPRCNGTGLSPDGAPSFVCYSGGRCSTDNPVPPCELCHGTKLMPAGWRYDPEMGRLMRGARVEAGVGLREAARMAGISGAELSRKEQGIFRTGGDNAS